MKKLGISLVAVTTLITGLIGATPAMATALDPSCTIIASVDGATITGTSNGDVICLNANNLTVNALGGNDTVIDYGSNNTVNLGIGADEYNGTAGNDGTVNGDAGNDELTGTPGEDTLNGGDGDDTIIGGAANDIISGGSGNDNLSGEAGGDNISGEAGDDTLNGGNDSDFLDGGIGDDTLIGGSADDTMRGGDGNDNLSGNSGRDNIFGEVGTDSVEGNEGDDVLSGGPGVDQVGRQEMLDSFGLNRCDYTNTEVKRTETCIYDDTPPTLDSFNWNKASYEVGNADASATLTISTSDDQGVGYIWVYCTGNYSDSWPVNIQMTAVNGIWSMVGTGNPTKLSQTVNSHSLELKVQVKIAMGTKPGAYQCQLQVRDLLDHYAYENGSALNITRANGNYDDEAPVISNFSWDSASYDTTADVASARPTFTMTDATGVRSFYINCYGNNNTPSPIYAAAYWDSTGRRWSMYGTANPTFGSEVTSNTNANVQVNTTIRQGFKPGNYQCYLSATDVQGHSIYKELPTLVITRGAGIFDDAGPSVSDFAWDKPVYDAGSQKVAVRSTFTISDATAVNYFQVYCQGKPNQPNPVSYSVYGSGSSWGVYGTGSPYIVSQSGNSQALTLTVESNLELGSYPGTHDCYVYARDSYEQYSNTTVNSIVIARTPAGMPNAPTNVRFETVAGKPNEGILSWDAPTFLGNPTLKDYQIDYSTNGSNWKTLYRKEGKSTETSYRITGGLVAGTDYWFRVRGENGGGFIEGSLGADWSEVLQTRTLDPSVPTPPTELVAKNITRTGANLSWTAPTFNGGALITDFLVETSRDEGVTWIAVPNKPVSTSVNLALTGLAPGTHYLVRTSAVNRAGNSEYAYLTEGFSTLTAPATKPKGLSASSISTTTLSLGWALPDSNGGTAISDYRVEVSGNGGNTWTPISHTPSNSLGFLVTNLTKGKTYKFRVAAVTTVGIGAYSDIFTATTTVSVPSAPTALSVKGITGTGAGLTWKAPSDNGGSPVYDYQIEVTRAGEDNWVLIEHPESTTKTYGLNGLTPGVSYQVRVAAVNAAGYSEFAEGAFTTAVVKPTAPLTLDASNVQTNGVTLTWSLPTSNGGAPLVDYKVEVSSNCSTFTAISHTPSNSLGFDVNNLAAGTKYCFRVSAKNSVGYSSPSEVLQLVTLGNAPSAPTALRVSNKSKTQVVLGWSAATVENGSKVRNYVVTYSSDQGATWTTVRKPVSTSTQLTVTGLRSATTYWFKVAAVNDVGTSDVQQNPLVVVTR